MMEIAPKIQALALAALLAGCSTAPLQWTGPGDHAQFYAAQSACLAQAGPIAQAAPGTQVQGFGSAGNAFATNYAAASNAQAARQQNALREQIFVGCMRGKGYRLVQ